MKRSLLLALLIPALSLTEIGGQEKKAPDTFVDPDKAGPDFAIQGEYEGTVGNEKLAAQIIALGGGKFDAFLLAGGLPGAGWNGKTRIKLTGILDRSPSGPIAGADFMGSDWSGKASAESPAFFKGKSPKGEEFTLRHVLRTSATEGARPPEGAIVLFGGKEADAWTGGKLIDEKWLGPGPTTRQGFRDFTLHVEFRLPFRPAARGQNRGNSGVYLQRRYEVQILDSFGLEPRNNDCGALYEQTPPTVNMCYPPLSWQTFDIDLTAAKYDEAGKKTVNAVVTVIHNGVKIHDRVELKGPTGNGRKEENTPGAINLQNHGNPVYFRNIWLVEKK
jgi:hypothetical protein